jgi:hypothetical protein
MRLPQVRFTVRRLMVAVAIIGLFLVCYRAVKKPWLRTITWTAPMSNGMPGYTREVLDLRWPGEEANWKRMINKLESNKIPYKIE